MKRWKVRALAYGGLLAALTTLFTAYVKLPLAVGYLHPGDGAIVLAALILGPAAALPAAIGSALADLLAGYVPYILPTLAIKGLVGLFFGTWLRARERVGARNVLGLLVGALGVVLGYFLFESLLYTPQTALAALPGNVFQAAVTLVIGCALLSAGERLPRLK